jgi:hypothetical protein
MPIDTATPFYANLDGLPVRGNYSEAWIYADNKWQKTHPAEINHNAHVMTQAAFAEMFGELPDLPSAAFHSGDKLSSTG